MSDHGTDLRRRRDELAGQVAALQYDLGGLAYEMAIRDHFRLDVLLRRAAVLQELDGELGEVDRLIASGPDGIGGECRSCGAPHSRGASYCWKCGRPLAAGAALEGDALEDVSHGLARVDAGLQGPEDVLPADDHHGVDAVGKQ